MPIASVVLGPVTQSDAPLLQALYSRTPKYFEIIAAPIPTLVDVESELKTALGDPRRQLELILDEHHEVVGYLDLKLNYPGAGDATINLLLIAEDLQSCGLGSQVATALEKRLPHTKRLLAGIYGDNTGAIRFWERLGYEFAVDARPLMTWYAKRLGSNQQEQHDVLAVR